MCRTAPQICLFSAEIGQKHNAEHDANEPQTLRSSIWSFKKMLTKFAIKMGRQDG